MDDLRDAIASAIDTQDETLSTDVETDVETPEYDDEPSDIDLDSIENESPELEDETPEGETPEGETVAEIPATDETETETEAPDPQGHPKNSIKAPIDWSPEERNDWSRIPRHLQEKIISREKHIADTVANTKDARNTHEFFSQLNNSFAPILAAEGLNVQEATKNLFNTAATLRMGSPQAKATMLADMVKEYGVDIVALDEALTGRIETVDPEQARIDQLVNERLQPYQQQMQQQQYQQQQQMQQQHDQKVQEVQMFAEKNEFLGDVYEDMAQMIEFATSKGQNLDLQTAYARAIQARPDIQRVIESRKAESLRAKKAAASTLATTRTGSESLNTDNSIRGALSAAWDND